MAPSETFHQYSGPWWFSSKRPVAPGASETGHGFLPAVSVSLVSHRLTPSILLAFLLGSFRSCGFSYVYGDNFMQYRKQVLWMRCVLCSHNPSLFLKSQTGSCQYTTVWKQEGDHPNLERGHRQSFTLRVPMSLKKRRPINDNRLRIMTERYKGDERNVQGK